MQTVGLRSLIGYCDAGGIQIQINETILWGKVVPKGFTAFWLVQHRHFYFSFLTIPAGYMGDAEKQPRAMTKYLKWTPFPYQQKCQ